MTWGAAINNPKRNANLRPVVMDRNSRVPCVFLVALKDMPQMTKFLWDYKDHLTTITATTTTNDNNNEKNNNCIKKNVVSMCIYVSGRCKHVPWHA